MRAARIDRAPLGRRGNTLMEVMIATALFAVVFLSSMALMESGQRFTKSTLEITNIEELSQRTLYSIERMLANASPNLPSTTAASLAAGSATVELTTNDGFPPRGLAVASPGLAAQEVFSYDGLGAGGELFALQRGLQCTEPASHSPATVEWCGVAVPWGLAGATTKRSLESGVPTVFRGLGAGFSFKVPVDPTGGLGFVQGTRLRWGAEVRGVGQTATGRKAVYFAPQSTFDEAAADADVNGDGDRVDVFDVGQLRRVAWDLANPNMDDDVGLCPPIVLQEQCNWGGDLDGDGFDDPLFLWDEATKELHIRLFVLGASESGLPVVRRVESILFLRNEEAAT